MEIDTQRWLSIGFCKILLLAGFLLGTCGCAPQSTAGTPALGDTFVRHADGMVMVFVPAGEFAMGITREVMNYSHRLCRQTASDSIAVCSFASFVNEVPDHLVTLDAFWIDRTEVTNQQYQRCVADGACTPPVQEGSYTRSLYYGEAAFDDYPVIWITQTQAAAYCAWAGGRLPTEAEWEYAARGPGNYLFPWGNDFDGTRLNYCDVNCPEDRGDPTFDDGYADTAPVGSYPTGVSWCGALDMAGNVREWVADWYGQYSIDPQINPQGPSQGTGVIPRGGCWLDPAENARSTNRGSNVPDHTEHKVGFRCAAGQDILSR